MPDIPEAPAAFHLLANATGAVCNLDRAYCFFLSKEMLYPGSRFRMADEMVETYVSQLVEAHAGAPVVEVGEPGLNAHRGRNNPCPCGSRRKWKHCHGTEPAP